MNVIMEDKTCRKLEESLALNESDDAWHLLRDRNYIEWWYFDVMNSDDSIVRGQFFISRDLIRPGYLRNGVRATYVGGDGTEYTIEKRFPPASFKGSAEVCNVEIESNYFRGDLSRCKIHIEDERIVLDLELHSDTLGFKSHACFGNNTTCMHWVVPQPRGRAQGVFRTGDKTYELQGIGYRDHNWLNFSPIDIIEYWDWGRVYDERFTIIFADIVTTKRYEKARIEPLIIYDSNEFIYLTNEAAKWSLNKAGVKHDPVTKVELPETHRINAADDDLSLEMDLHLKRVFQRIDPLVDLNPIVRWLIRTFKGKPAVTSYHSAGSGSIGLHGQHYPLKCNAVHEHVTNV